MAKKAVEIHGLDGLELIFKITGPQAARRVMKGATADVARMIRDEAKQNVPRRTGRLRKSIKAHIRRGKPGEFRTSVVVETGHKAKDDGFYWRFVEFGTYKSQTSEKSYSGKNKQNRRIKRRGGDDAAGSQGKPFLRPAFESVKSQVGTAFTSKIKQRIISEIKKVS